MTIFPGNEGDSQVPNANNPPQKGINDHAMFDPTTQNKTSSISTPFAFNIIES